MKTLFSMIAIAGLVALGCTGEPVDGPKTDAAGAGEAAAKPADETSPAKRPEVTFYTISDF